VVINLDTRDHRPQTGFTRWQVTITESPTKKVTEGFDTHGRQLSRTGGSGFDAFKRSQDDCAPVVEGGDAILEAGIECNDPILDRTISSVLYNPEMKLSH
jgi:hypothetical protein